MMASSIALFCAVFLSVLYAILAAMAFSHTDKRKLSPLFPQLIALTFWWPFYDMYDERGKKLCKYGRIILPIAIAAYVVWGIKR